MSDCIYFKIAAKEIPSYTVWESETHMAFFNIVTKHRIASYDNAEADKATLAAIAEKIKSV